MRTYIISIMLSIASIFSMTGKDRLYIENFNILAGETIRVPVILQNETAYSGLQTDIYLPEGLSIDMEDGEYIIDLTNRGGNSHTVGSNKLSSGAIRVYISSVNAQEFLGNSGAIMTICITAAQNFLGSANISLKNTICAEAIGTRHVLDDEICKVNDDGIDTLVGDVNHDGEVNIADINAIIDIVLGGNTNDEMFGRADVNGDGEVNIADINAVIDIILSH